MKDQVFFLTDRADRFLSCLSLFRAFVLGWGVAFFVLMIGLLPAGALLSWLAPPLLRLSDERMIVIITLWFGLSVPAAVLSTLHRLGRLREERVHVTPKGFVYHRYLRRPMQVGWDEVRALGRLTSDGDESLRVETAVGTVCFDADEWDLPGLRERLSEFLPRTGGR